MEALILVAEPRPNDAAAHRRPESLEPSPRPGSTKSQRDALGKAEAGPVTIVPCDGGHSRLLHDLSPAGSQGRQPNVRPRPRNDIRRLSVPHLYAHDSRGEVGLCRLRINRHDFSVYEAPRKPMRARKTGSWNPSDLSGGCQALSRRRSPPFREAPMTARNLPHRLVFTG